MRYKNISDKAITIERVSIKQQALKSTTHTIQPGEEFLTSPGRAVTLLESGQIEKVSGGKPVSQPAAQTKEKEPS